MRKIYVLSALLSFSAHALFGSLGGTEIALRNFVLPKAQKPILDDIQSELAKIQSLIKEGKLDEATALLDALSDDDRILNYKDRHLLRQLRRQLLLGGREQMAVLIEKDFGELNIQTRHVIPPFKLRIAPTVGGDGAASGGDGAQQNNPAYKEEPPPVEYVVSEPMGVFEILGLDRTQMLAQLVQTVRQDTQIRLMLAQDMHRVLRDPESESKLRQVFANDPNQSLIDIVTKSGDLIHDIDSPVWGEFFAVYAEKFYGDPSNLGVYIDAIKGLLPAYADRHGFEIDIYQRIGTERFLCVKHIKGVRPREKHLNILVGEPGGGFKRLVIVKTECEVIQGRHKQEMDSAARYVIDQLEQKLKDPDRALVDAQEMKKFMYYDLGGESPITMSDYVLRLAQWAEVSKVSLLGALALIERLPNNGLVLTEKNVFLLYATALRVASKVLEMRTILASNFAQVGGFTSKRSLNRYEEHFLQNVLEFKVYLDRDDMLKRMRQCDEWLNANGLPLW